MATSNQRVKLIVNPTADMGRAWRWAADLHPIIEDLGGADWAGTVYPTHATQLAQQAAEQGAHLVIAIGGDGTVHEVVNGLMRVPPEQRPRLGVVPLGSGNDFAHALGMDPRSPFALRQVLTGKPRRVDVGLLRDGRGRSVYWNNSVGIGFDATVVIRSRNIPYVRGFLIYLFAVLQTILLNHTAPHLKVTTGDRAWQSYLQALVLCNGPREGGGFHICPPASPHDELLNYVAVERISRPMMLRILPEILKGTHLRFRQVQSGTFTHMEVEADRPLFIHTDGEIFAGFGVDVRKLSSEIIPGAIEVMV